MSTPKRFSTLLAALFLTGCAALSDISGAGSGTSVGGYRDDGSYELTEGERTLSCARLAQAELSIIDAMKVHVAQAKTERAAAAPTAIGFLKRTFGGAADGIAALEEYKRKAAISDAFAAEKQRRPCPADGNAAMLAATKADAAAMINRH